MNVLLRSFLYDFYNTFPFFQELRNIFSFFLKDVLLMGTCLPITGLCVFISIRNDEHMKNKNTRVTIKHYTTIHTQVEYGWTVIMIE